MIEKIKHELMSIEEGIHWMEDSDTVWLVAYTILCKKRRLLKRTLRKLERLEARKNDRA